MLRASQVCPFVDLTSLSPSDNIPDLKGVDQMTFNFDLGTPFKPFEQLMGVLPAASQELIPSPFRVRPYVLWG